MKCPSCGYQMLFTPKKVSDVSPEAVRLVELYDYYVKAPKGNTSRAKLSAQRLLNAGHHFPMVRAAIIRYRDHVVKQGTHPEYRTRSHNFFHPGSGLVMDFLRRLDEGTTYLDPQTRMVDGKRQILDGVGRWVDAD